MILSVLSSPAFVSGLMVARVYGLNEIQAGELLSLV